MKSLRPAVILRRWQKGRHSGYPTCCIAWFCFIKTPFIPIKFGEWKLKLIDRFGLSYTGYVRCPLCLVRGRRVIQHMCDECCAGQEGSSYR
jgi:hypothetical protein